MERLTQKETGEILIKDGWSRSDTNNYTSLCYGCSEFYMCKNRCGFYKALERLAEYEDTGLTPDEIKEQIEILKHNYKCMEDTLERQYDNARKLLDEQEKDCDYWKREALKWANEIGEQRIGPLIWMDEERIKNERNQI